MKRNRITWVMPIIALCLLATACSENNNGPTGAKTRSLTIGCGIGTSTSDTRAGVTPGNPDKLEENFIWHKGDAFDGWLIPQGENSYLSTRAKFAIDDKYETPSKSALFTCSDFPNESAGYKMLATYPNDGFTQKEDGSFTYSFSETTQIGRSNTDHLGGNMKMYATTTVTSANEIPAMTFQHLSALLRFTVTNKNTSACRINRISIKCKGDEAPVFGISYSLKVDDWGKGTITHLYTQGAANLTLTTQNTPTDNGGIELSATGDTDKHDVVDTYMMVGPSDTKLNGQGIIFEIRVTEDGKERTYTSLVVNGDDILKNDGSDSATTWEPGKRYWFNLLLDDKLTATLKEVTDMPGWDNETEL